jgi:antitoxin component of MazEF toxin-antitoxin module
MIKATKKVRNSQRIILDAPLIEMVHLNVGDEMHVTVHEGGSMTFTPLRPVISPNAAGESARRIIGKNKELFKRLSS